MVRTIDVHQAQSLIAGGDVEIIDVREPAEWATGHLPGARLVPLGEFRGDPQAKITGARVLFVCAKGGRSLTAAQLADGLGVGEIYSLDGGTIGWASAGLPIEKP